MSQHDPVNHPSHYVSHPSGVECIEITRHMSFNIGNVVKYVWRAGQKATADHLEDLKKARFYLNDEISRLDVYGDDPVTFFPDDSGLADFDTATTPAAIVQISRMHDDA